MKYAITFTYEKDWDSTDTLLVEVNKSLIDNPNLIKEALKNYGVEQRNIDYIVNKGLYFLRNCEDTDINMEIRG